MYFEDKTLDVFSNSIWILWYVGYYVTGENFVLKTGKTCQCYNLTHHRWFKTNKKNIKIVWN